MHGSSFYNSEPVSHDFEITLKMLTQHSVPSRKLFGDKEPVSVNRSECTFVRVREHRAVHRGEPSGRDRRCGARALGTEGPHGRHREARSARLGRGETRAAALPRSPGLGLSAEQPGGGGRSCTRRRAQDPVPALRRGPRRLVPSTRRSRISGRKRAPRGDLGAADALSTPATRPVSRATSARPRSWRSRPCVTSGRAPRTPRPVESFQPRASLLGSQGCRGGAGISQQQTLTLREELLGTQVELSFRRPTSRF